MPFLCKCRFCHDVSHLLQDSDQLELLREFMKLQKEMMIMLLSMLEGRYSKQVIPRGKISCVFCDNYIRENFANSPYILCL